LDQVLHPVPPKASSCGDGGGGDRGVSDHLAIKRNVSASTQNQALSALLFLYKEVLELELSWLNTMERAKKPQRLPTVFTVREVNEVLGKLEGTIGLMVRLLYGTGMRLMQYVFPAPHSRLTHARENAAGTLSMRRRCSAR